MLPLFQFPNIAAWRTDQLGGPVDQDAGQLPGVPEHRTSGRTSTATARSSSVPSSGRSASTRSPSAPTRPGTSGRRRSRCCPAFGTPPPRVRTCRRQPGHRRARGRRQRLTGRSTRQRERGRPTGLAPLTTSGRLDIAGPGTRSRCRSGRRRMASVIRFVIRRLLWAIPTLLIDHLPGVLGDPPRHRSGRRATSASTREPREEMIEEYKDANGLNGSSSEQYFTLARQLRHVRLGRLDQGQPAGVARAQERDGQHARARHHAVGRRDLDRSGDRDPLRAAAPFDVRHRRHDGGLRRHQHPAVRLRGAAAAALRHHAHRLARLDGRACRSPGSTRPDNRASTSSCGPST